VAGIVLVVISECFLSVSGIAERSCWTEGQSVVGWRRDCWLSCVKWMEIGKKLWGPKARSLRAGAKGTKEEWRKWAWRVPFLEDFRVWSRYTLGEITVVRLP
jgi:hypothetical protein